MEFKSILDSVSKIRQNLQEKRKIHNYSRSISPRQNEILNKSNNSNENVFVSGHLHKQKLGIPTSREELLEKYSSSKCPLPKPVVKQKTYKLDAADLISSCLHKIIRKNFFIIKEFNKQKTSIGKKPPINRAARGKSISEIEKTNQHSFNNTKINKTFYIPKNSEKKSEILFYFTTLLQKKVSESKKNFFFVCKNFFTLGLVGKLKKILNPRLRSHFKSFIKISASKLDLSKIVENNGLGKIRFSTPRPYEENNYVEKGDDMKEKNWEKHNSCNSGKINFNIGYTPGKIVKNIYLQNSDGKKIHEKGIKIEENAVKANEKFHDKNEKHRKFSDDFENRSKFTEKGIIFKRNVENYELDSKNNYEQSTKNSENNINILEHNREISKTSHKLSFSQNKSESSKIRSNLTEKIHENYASSKKNIEKFDSSFSNSEYFWQNNDKSNFNPTFGSESDEENFSISIVHQQNMIRRQEIEKSIKKLEQTNKVHKKILESARKDSLNSSYSKVLNDSSMLRSPDPQKMTQKEEKKIFRAEISPIKSIHKSNISEISNAIDETWNGCTNEMTEELSLKSFNQNTHYSSFDKEISIVKHKEDDSFELKFENIQNHEGKNNRYNTESSISPTFNYHLEFNGTGKFPIFQQPQRESENKLKKSKIVMENILKNPGKIVKIAIFVETLKKKVFLNLLSCWKSLKNMASQRKIREKFLLRKTIEKWEKEVLFKQDKWIECFYHWRGVLKQEKMNKLKHYKKFFS